jgi:hypothetical protein
MLQAKQLEISSKPKTVSIGGVETDASGKITGATINSTIQ